jgi:hypothetical protein
MTTIAIGPGFLLNMLPGGGTLADLAAAGVQSATETELVLLGGGPTYTISGTGFSGDGGNGLPAEGTVTAFSVVYDTFPIATISDISMSWSTFWGFVVLDNYTGFLAALLDGNDNISGEALDDVLFGFQGIDDIYGNGGNDVIVGGRGGDAMYGGDGDDVLRGTAGDVVDGGAGFDRFSLKGDYSGGLVIDSWMSGIEMLRLASDASYDLTMDDAVVAPGETLTVNAEPVDGGHGLSFNGSAETDGRFVIFGSAGNDILTGGALGDVFHFGSGGADTVRYTAVAQSTGTAHDVVHGFDAGDDIFDLDVTVAGFSGDVFTGVSAATFDDDIGNAFGDTLPGANHAWVLNAIAGDLNGSSFLVVDANGDAVYTAGSDYVIDITGYTGTLDAADFI